jgi:uncharacterized protein (TIGR00297 family)
VIPRFVIGLLLSAVTAWVAYRRQMLTRSGALGAIITGTLTLAAGLNWALILIAFFLSSSILSKFGAQRKATAREQFSKSDQRDLWQVMANGGLGTIIAVLYILTGEDTLWIPYLASFATVNADTWATELGTLSRQTPRLITTLRKAEPGTSGAVTPAGTLASLAGAAFIGVIGGLWDDFLQVMVIVTLAGLVGSLFDSLLGATVQGLYECDGKLTEKETCQDGSPAILRQGYRLMNNDVVNFGAALFGTLLAYLMLKL